ncbi:MAG: cation transporting ATPase C-terminal domain-containing protein, partial [Planctomycetes bacterium]|nr:cation transporting ATPase C-terminal domain-containing protein [Planctomycetota bacterium]
MDRAETERSGFQSIDTLRERVIRAAILISGAIPAPGVEGESRASRGLIVLLFRILVLRFAASRGLLPKHGPVADLYAVINAVSNRKALKSGYGRGSLWKTLRTLFCRIDEQGSLALTGEVSSFFPATGSLFDRESTRLLARFRGADEQLCAAFESLCFCKGDKAYGPEDYSVHPPENLGFLYESLLPYFPGLWRDKISSGLSGAKNIRHSKDPARTERRRNGAFYTRRGLVEVLIDSALQPTLRDAFERGGLPIQTSPGKKGALLDQAGLDSTARTAAERILLDFKVVDPACGSASFLLAAQDYLAKQLLLIRWGTHATTSMRESAARRDVLPCLHGVDKDPWAVELARIGLWLNTGVCDLPRGALDAQIKRGDALVGAPLPSATGDRSADSRTACDRWTASFFLSQNPEFYRAGSINGPDPIIRFKSSAIKKVAQDHRFFHWHLEFPEVFSRSSVGFDCVLANPPWERIKLQEREFFSIHAPSIAGAGKASSRRALIGNLENTDPSLHRAYRQGLLRSSRLSRFLRESGRYALATHGDPNTYLFFLALGRALLASTGRAGLVVPSGFATDKGSSRLFRDLVRQEALVSLYDFFNRKRIFPEIAGPNRFCLITINGPGLRSPHPAFQFACGSLNDLKKKDRRFHLTREEFRLLNPNTETCPPFPDRFTAEKVQAIYRKMPVLLNRAGCPATKNPWSLSFWNMFHMTNRSQSFRTGQTFQEKGIKIKNRFRVSAAGLQWVRLYESKLFHAFNLRHEKKSLFQIGPFTNKFLVGALLFGLLLQTAVIMLPGISVVFKVLPLA